MSATAEVWTPDLWVPEGMSQTRELLEVIHEHRAFQILPRNQRLWLEARPLKMVDWAKRERWLCRQDTGRVFDPSQGFAYWIERYGVVRPKAGGAEGAYLKPLEMFDAQREKMVPALIEAIIVYFLKSRQFGATTIDTHHTAWLLGLSEKSYGIDCFNSSNNRDNAQKYAARTREILIAQPPWLRVPVGKEQLMDDGKEADDSKTVFQLPTRKTTLTSVAATGAARSGAVRKFTGDESAFPPSSVAPEAWIAASLPTTKNGGQAVFISTGNGDEFDEKAGRAFAKGVRRAQRGEGEGRLVFISRDEDPNFKMSDWEEVAAISGPAKANAEYPRNVDEALQGDSEGKAYDSTWVEKAVELGQHFDDLREQGMLPPPVDDEIEAGVDWGKNSSGVVLWPLAGHGLYICDEEIAPNIASASATSFSARILERVQLWELKRRPGTIRGGAHFATCRYDAAGYQQSLDMRDVLPPQVEMMAVPFGDYKTKTVEFLRTMLRRASEGQDIGFIAISPRCKQLLSELRTLEVDQDGKIVKGRDHAHDALIAVLSVWGDRWREDYQ